MTKTLSFKKQKNIISYMLGRKFPDIPFTLVVDDTYTPGCTSWERFIIVSFPKATNVTTKEVANYLKRFSDDPINEKGITYMRTFWINEKGHATLARIRAKHADGTFTLVEKFPAPDTDGPYTMQRFDATSYKVEHLGKKKLPYAVYDYD